MSAFILKLFFDSFVNISTSLPYLCYCLCFYTTKNNGRIRRHFPILGFFKNHVFPHRTAPHLMVVHQYRTANSTTLPQITSFFIRIMFYRTARQIRRHFPKVRFSKNHVFPHCTAQHRTEPHQPRFGVR